MNDTPNKKQQMMNKNMKNSLTRLCLLFMLVGFSSCSDDDEQQVTKLNIEPEHAEIKVGESLQLEFTTFPQGAVYQSLQWEINNNELASLSNEGLLSGLKEGIAQIKLTANNGVSGTINAIVLPKDFEVPEKLVGNWACVKIEFDEYQRIYNEQEIKEHFMDESLTEEEKDEAIRNLKESYAYTINANKSVKFKLKVTRESGTEIVDCPAEISGKENLENSFLLTCFPEQAGLEGVPQYLSSQTLTYTQDGYISIRLPVLSNVNCNYYYEKK